MPFLVASIAIVLVSFFSSVFIRITLISILLTIFFPFIHKGSLSAITVVQVLETLVIYPQFIVVPVLNNIEHVIANLEWILEVYSEFLDFVKNHSIFENFFFTTEMAADEFD